MTKENHSSEENKQEENFDKKLMNHDYDGIKELNNPPPYWIMAVFIITIVFSMFYVIHNFGYPNNGKDQKSQYEQKVAAFEIKKEEMRKAAMESGIELSQDQLLIAGAELYTSKGCTVCHGQNGEGNNIGPNLTDNYWLHGCSKDEVVKMITEGRPEKGMTAYKSMMTSQQIDYLAEHILVTLRGSNPPNAKAAQGEECQ